MSRPGNVFHPDFDQGLPTYFDIISVRNSLQPSYVVQAATRVGIATEAGEIEKDIRHNSWVSDSGSVFHPLVVESLGLWTAHSLKILKTIARRLTFHNNISQSVDYLYPIHTSTSNRASPCWPGSARFLVVV